MSTPIVVGAAVATLLFALAPALRFAWQAPEMRVALETACALIALLASYLVLGRFLRARHLDSLVLAASLGVLACASLVAAGLLAFPPSPSGRLVAATATAIGALMLAASAFVPQRPLVRGGHDALAFVAATGVLVVLLAGVLTIVDHLFPAGAVELVHDGRHAHLESHVALLAAETIAMAAFVVAAVAFARRQRIESDSFFAFLAAGAMLGAIAQLDYILFASAGGDLVRVGDVFRALSYAVLLVGAAREIGEYWRRLAQTAVLEERRRIARDLHDGVTQELLYIARRATRLAATGDETAREIQASAERAIGDSRRAIAALTRPLDQPLDEVLTEAVEEVAARYDVRLDLAFDPTVSVDADAREALVRIACEAVSNAARHGRAHVVRLWLSNGDGVHFGVADDGTGFDPDVPSSSRFGIAIMRERAQAAGGSFRLRSAPGRGTELEVVFP
jgi:signal transduction histidine kinase